MELKKVEDLFNLAGGEVVSKRNLFDLVQLSKVEGSLYWSGRELVIGNTPQQGINWVGELPSVRAVIIKTRPGRYARDGWSNNRRTYYHYSFKARKSVISDREKANRVLISQPQHLYPILLFTEHKGGWLFEGTFSVTAIKDTFVVLVKGNADAADVISSQEELQYHEGGRRYVTHLMAERSKGIVKALKETKEWICDICQTDFMSRYHVKYIEAHHKIPITAYSSSYKVRPSDLVLLCPNCHRAAHIYMKLEGMEYQEIKAKLSGKEFEDLS